MGRDREPKHAKPQTKNRRLQIHDLRAVHWNVRGKTVQEVLDTMQDIIHAPDFLLLQEVGGLVRRMRALCRPSQYGRDGSSTHAFMLILLKALGRPASWLNIPLLIVFTLLLRLRSGLLFNCVLKVRGPFFFSLVISHTGREQMPKMFGAKELRKFRICCNNVVQTI